MASHYYVHFGSAFLTISGSLTSRSGIGKVCCIFASEPYTFQHIFNRAYAFALMLFALSQLHFGGSVVGSVPKFGFMCHHNNLYGRSSVVGLTQRTSG